MSTFHKPRLYRTATGCCICKAKSSSSRFAESKKYENDFPLCFQLSTPRQGEICNACVLLVKRFRRLPAGSSRHWGHVVDARSGPGMKCMSKVKQRCEDLLLKCSNIDKGEGCVSDDNMWSDDETPSDDEDKILCRKRKLPTPRRNITKPIHNGSFLNRRSWEKISFGCSDVWKNSYGQTILDLSSVHPCSVRLIGVQECAGYSAVPGKLFNDNSSDSGYDEAINLTLLQNINNGTARKLLGYNNKNKPY